MEKYEKLEIEVIELDGVDVITASCDTESSEMPGCTEES